MLTVLVPSRGREQNAREAYEAFAATKILSDTEMLIVLDAGESDYPGLPTVHVEHEQPGMGPALNAALEYAAPDIYAFTGDDHRFRTRGWDVMVTEANAKMGGGLVYGNDLFQREKLPTAIFMDARIVDTLGWMALPGATHLYLDNTWLWLGQALGRLRYLEDMIVEHCHPEAGKAAWDDAYRRVNSGVVYVHDAKVFAGWMEGQAQADLDRVLEALG